MAGKRWSFIDGAHPVQILGRGWAAPSDVGLWNDGTSATLKLGDANVPAMLTIDGQTFAHRQRVRLFAGKTQLAELILPQEAERCVAVPPDMLLAGQSLRLEFPDADVPYNLGFNADRRTLALCLTGLEWRPVMTAPVKCPRLFGTFLARPVASILRIWGRGAAPDARFRLNDALVFSCPVQNGGTWSVWLAISPEQASASRLKLDIYRMDGALIDVAGIDQYAIDDESGGGAPILLHMVYKPYQGDVREITQTSGMSFVERIERHLYKLISSHSVTSLPSLPEEPPLVTAPPSNDAAGSEPAAPPSPVQVTYNAAARLLMIRVALDEGVDEVRVLGDESAELARVRSSGPEARAATICAPEALPLSLTIRHYSGADCVEEQVIRRDAIQLAGLEVAALALDGAEISGAFWVGAGAGSDWQLTCQGAIVGQAHMAEGCSLADLSLSAIPFRIPLPDRDIQPAHDKLPGDRIWITPIAPGVPVPVQRPLTLSRVQLKGPHRPARELAALRDIHRGRAAWIIGNGPSVRLEDLEAIPTGDVVFAFNRFYLSYADHPLREDYVVSADAQMVDDFGQEIIERSSGLPLFCRPREALSHLRGRFVALTPGNSALPVFSTDPAHFVSVGGSSVFVALQMAWYMGLRDIRLYGMDYSFNTVLSDDLGGGGVMAVNDGNHFIPNYRGDRPWHPPSWADIATGFLNARIAFELDGGRIVNATRGGRLEIFQRMDLPDLIAETC
ncbi:6-hydroxymethylpterin diphosphokinase MptE-like protein [Asticcacaulis sp.]|uniref:6-hydroxymethylpterin diphosphokinase MptE-like protein n=1 Tax=Asticcacaulis sp. TaxID=1872648 RepID=UPI003F7C4B45